MGIAYQEKAIALIENVITSAENNPDTLSDEIVEIYTEAGAFHCYAKHYEISIEFYQKAITLVQSEYGTESGLLIKIYCELADIYNEMQNVSAQIEYLGYAVEIAEHTYGETHIQTADIYDKYSMAAINCTNNRILETATEYCKKSFEIYSSIYGENCEDTADCLFCRLILMYQLEQQSECYHSIKRLQLIYQALYEDDAEEWGDFYLFSAKIYAHFMDFTAAKKLMPLAIRIYKMHGNDDDAAKAQEILLTFE